MGGLPPGKSELAGLTHEELAAIPPEYWDLSWVFEEEELDKLPSHRTTDCAIELLLREPLSKAKLYSMSNTEQEELCKFIEKNLT